MAECTVYHLMRGLVVYVLILLVQIQNLPAKKTEETERTGPSVTVFLMPNEPAAEDVGEDISEDVERFNATWAGDLVVLNTTETILYDQLYAVSPEYAAPNWSVVKGQTGTLAALKRFAEEHNITIYVRLLTWGTALDEIRKGLAVEPESRLYPDVVQVGSTWRGYLSDVGHMLAPTAAQAGNLTWHTIGDTKTLPYIRDVRLIYYWRKELDGPEHDTPLVLKDSSWPDLVASLQDYLSVPAERTGRRRPAWVFPILQSSNLLHDYAMFVWAGGARIFDARTSKVDLTSPEALLVPQLITRNVRPTDANGNRYSLFAFPEASHSEAMNHFIAGEYTAIIEPVGFLPYLRTHFESRCANMLEREYQIANAGGEVNPDQKRDAARRAAELGRRLFEYIDLAVPPVTFEGGSDLVVTRRATRPDEAFRVARFLASPTAELHKDYAKSYARILASRGLLPAQMKDTSIETLLADLHVSGDTTQIRQLLLEAVKVRSRRYPDRKDWVEKIRTGRSREKIQIIWRRMSQGDVEAVAEAARDAESVIRYEIDDEFRAAVDGRRPEVLEARATAAEERAKVAEERGKRLKFGAFAVVTVVIVLLIGVVRTRRTRDRDRRSLGLLSMMSIQIDNVHRESRRWVETRLRPEKGKAERELQRAQDIGDTKSITRLEAEIDKLEVRHEGRAERAEMMITGLRDLQRGLAASAAGPETLEDVVWRAILRAIDNVEEDQEGVYDDWLSLTTQLPIPDYLRQRKLLRADGAGDASPNRFGFDLVALNGVHVRDAIIVEFALACVLQNAIEGSTDGDAPHRVLEKTAYQEGYHHTIEVSYTDAPEPSLTICNVNCSGKTLDKAMVSLLNQQPFDPQDAEARLREYFRTTPESEWIGLGLILAKTSAELFLGGLDLHIDKNRACVTVRLGSKYLADRKGRLRWLYRKMWT